MQSDWLKALLITPYYKFTKHLSQLLHEKKTLPRFRQELNWEKNIAKFIELSKTDNKDVNDNQFGTVFGRWNLTFNFNINASPKKQCCCFEWKCSAYNKIIDIFSTIPKLKTTKNTPSLSHIIFGTALLSKRG